MRLMKKTLAPRLLSVTMLTLLACGARPISMVARVGAPNAPRMAPTAPALGVEAQWLYVDPRHPRTLLVGGTHNAAGGAPPLQWTMRSTDGGVTWDDLSRRLGDDTNTGTVANGDSYTGPPVSTPDDRHLVLSAGFGYGRHFQTYLRASSDEGMSWGDAADPVSVGGGNGGVQALATSPATPGRLYALAMYEPDNGIPSFTVSASDDGGGSWLGNGKDLPDPPLCCSELFADPRRPGIVYVQSSYGSNGALPIYRGAYNGGGWTPLPVPFHLHSLDVTADPHEGTALLGTTQDKGVPSDRRYLSHDQGMTWSVTTCPGDAAGACPAFTLDGVFGAGASYAFVHDGVYRFHGGGQAEARLGLSGRLPVRTAYLAAVAGGTHAGDPVYLLAGGVHGGQIGLLYCSTDAGATWRLLPDLPVLPGHAAPSTARGALFVAAAHHSVAAPFVATYHRLGLQVVGLPVTEAYTQGEALQQDFDHLRLVLRGGHVVAGDLGTQVTGADDAALAKESDPSLSPLPYDAGALAPVRPSTSTPNHLYVPQTRHTLGGALLRYWKAHGGMGTFGAPISEAFSAANDDGSGRTYTMQWFQNARLELHPEIHNPRYSILEGLIGDELLRWRGEMPLPSLS